MHCSVTVPLMVPVMLPPPHARTLRGHHCKSEEALASANMGLALARQLQRYDYVLQTASADCYGVHGMAATQSMRAVSSAHCFVWIRLHHAAPTALHQT